MLIKAFKLFVWKSLFHNKFFKLSRFIENKFNFLGLLGVLLNYILEGKMNINGYLLLFNLFVEVTIQKLTGTLLNKNLQRC